jgi:hypothetical protein
MKNTVIVLLIVAIVIYIVFTCSGSSKRNEKYGGVIKNVTKIPLSDCYRKCEQWRVQCNNDRPGNAGGCDNIAEGCKLECYYSNSHRM